MSIKANGVDVGLVCEHHDKAVEADGDASGRRYASANGVHEWFVNWIDLAVFTGA